MKEQVSKVKKAGIDIGGFFILGFPGETVHQMRRTINFARDLNLDRIGISYFQPYPGTKEYSILVDSGDYRLYLNGNRLSLHSISYTTMGVGKRKLRMLRCIGFIKFYFRFKIFIKLIKAVKDLDHLIFIVRRGIRWLST